MALRALTFHDPRKVGREPDAILGYFDVNLVREADALQERV
jgi:hypothetical protein